MVLGLGSLKGARVNIGITVRVNIMAKVSIGIRVRVIVRERFSISIRIMLL